MSIISCEGLTLGYDSKIVAKDVNFSLNTGDYLCIVGENGSGKTTLMRTLLGLIPPICGKVMIPRGGIGYLPQQTDIQRDFPASVREVVLSGFAGKNGFKPFFSSLQKEQAQAEMDRLDISDISERSYRTLSGGQQQRVLLARALCASSGILLMDEPTAALDPEASARMYEIISDLNKKENATVIMITHDVKVAIEHATHVLHVGDSCIFSTRDEYLKARGDR